MRENLFITQHVVPAVRYLTALSSRNKLDLPWSSESSCLQGSLPRGSSPPWPTVWSPGPPGPMLWVPRWAPRTAESWWWWWALPSSSSSSDPEPISESPPADRLDGSARERRETPAFLITIDQQTADFENNDCDSFYSRIVAACTEA